MKNLFFAAALFSLAFFAACDKKNDPEPQPSTTIEPTDTTPTRDTTPTTDTLGCSTKLDTTVVIKSDTVMIDLSTISENSDGDFTFNIVKQLNTAKNDNFFLSPISVKLAFAMLANGANNNSRTQIIEALGYKGKSINDLNNDCHNLISEWKKLNTENANRSEEFSKYGEGKYQQTIETADAIWADVKFPLSENFIAQCNNYYDAEASTLNFANTDSALAVMNEWGNQKTHGMIPQMINKDDISNNVMTILANALYFKADWKKSFYEYLTKKADFTNEDQSKTKVDMMQQQSYFKYVRTESFAMVELPYSGTTCMDVILPSDGVSISQCISNLSQSRFNAAIKEMSLKEIHLKLPKFDFNFKHNLIDIMKNLGMIDIFDGEKADLSLMGEKYDKAFVGKAFQVSRVSVDEEGTEAAAVTIIAVEATSAPFNIIIPIEFNVNRPFIYIIRETKTNEILFIGKTIRM